MHISLLLRHKEGKNVSLAIRWTSAEDIVISEINQVQKRQLVLGVTYVWNLNQFSCRSREQNGSQQRLEMEGSRLFKHMKFTRMATLITLDNSSSKNNVPTDGFLDEVVKIQYNYST